MHIKKISGALGAEISGVDLSGELNNDIIAALRQALLDNLVIFLRDQPMTSDKFLAFARNLGKPIEYPFVKGLAGYPEIIEVAKLEHEKTNFGGTLSSHLWARCCCRAKFPLMVGTQCSPICIWLMRLSHPVCRKCFQA